MSAKFCHFSGHGMHSFPRVAVATVPETEASHAGWKVARVNLHITDHICLSEEHWNVQVAMGNLTIPWPGADADQFLLPPSPEIVMGKRAEPN